MQTTSFVKLKARYPIASLKSAFIVLATNAKHAAASSFSTNPFRNRSRPNQKSRAIKKFFMLPEKHK